MIVLRRTDHMHFLDKVAELHEGFRTMPVQGDLEEIQREMLPFVTLASAEAAHVAIRGLTLAHFDATLRSNEEARAFLDGDVARSLGARGLDVIVEVQ